MTDLKIQEQAEKLYPNRTSNDYIFGSYHGFLNGAKWMQEQDEWISVEILPVAGTECYFIVQFTNEFGLQNIPHTGIFGALGFTSYHDSENYSIKEVTKHFPLPSPPKTK